MPWRRTGEWRAVMVPHILNSTLDGGEWSALRLGRFNVGVSAPGTRWIGGWVGLRTIWMRW